jgi:hypothetical protein
MSFAQGFLGLGRGDCNVTGMLVALARFIMEVLGQYQDYFEPGQFLPNLIFVGPLGKIQLIKEYLGIWAGSNLGQYP